MNKRHILFVFLMVSWNVIAMDNPDANRNPLVETLEIKQGDTTSEA